MQRELPDGVEQVTVVKADADAQPVVRLAAYSETLGEEDLTWIVENDIVPELLSIAGVTDVSVYGERQRMLHVVVDPLRLTAFGLSVSDVADVLDTAPMDVPAGSFQSQDLDLIVRADASALDPAQIKSLILRDTVTIGDVAEVYFGPEDPSSYFRLDGPACDRVGHHPSGPVQHHRDFRRCFRGHRPPECAV